MRHARRDVFAGSAGWVAVLVLASQVLLPAREARAQLPEPRLWLAPMQADDVPGARLLSEKFDEAVRRQLERSQKLDLTDKARTASRSRGRSSWRTVSVACAGAGPHTPGASGSCGAPGRGLAVLIRTTPRCRRCTGVRRCGG